MRLASVVKGRQDKPMRVLLYGVEGIGKSTFAANAPSPIFIPVEDGTAHLDVARFPKPSTWAEVIEAIDEIGASEHDFRTVVVDTLDALEALCWAHVVTKAASPKVKSIEDFGYGKGYTAALEEWRLFLSHLERLRNQRGMHVMLLAHSLIKTFKNPEDEDFDRYQLRMHDKAGGLLKDWCDCVLFARYETFVSIDDRAKRARGVSTGARVIHTQRTAAWDAKNRYDLPETLPLDWEAFHGACARHAPASADKLRERIATMLASAEDLRERVEAAVAKAGADSALLAKIANKLTAEVQLRAQENAR
jgi:hypothetical protein